ncbi:MAG: OmpA family protein [Bacteroidota bacterium]|nr:OmpA family protein [Bacteroidota bacterium]
MVIKYFKLIGSLVLFCNNLLYLKAQKGDSTVIQITNIGNSINSIYPEYAPVISADGALLIYTTKRPGEGKKKQKEILEQIWLSEFNSNLNTWGFPNPLPKNINNPKRNISNIALSNDGHKLLLYVDELTGTGDISESVLKGTLWSDPIKLPAPINSPSHESSATYSPDGKTIYFVSDRSGGKGGRDIWSCTQDKTGNWGKAINLGTKINSIEDEESLFMHPDGKTLYFSSKRKGGIGGYDIYKAELIKNKWSVPINLGKPINTDGDDLFFVMVANGKTAYYSSNQKGTLGEKDIFKITFSSINKKKEIGPRLTIIKGTVFDEKTNQALEADIELIDNEKNDVIAKFKSNSATGKYLISLPSGKNYGITVASNGYLFHSENINLPDSAAFQEIIKNIKLKKLEIGSTIVLNNIFFESNKSTLKNESETELKRLFQLLIDNSAINIEISGHTDNLGSSAYNQKLSEARAKTVVDYLTAKGINSQRMTFKGYGLEQPIATNDNEFGRQLNRRTEFKIIGK